MLNPDEMFANFLIHMKKMLNIIGVNVLEPVYKLNRHTCILIIAITTYFLGTFYTVYIEIQNDWRNVLNCLCMFGSAFAGLIKFASGIFYKKDMWQTTDCLTNIFLEYSNKTKKLDIILQEKLKLFSYILKIFLFMYVTAGSFIALAPPLIYLATGRMLFVLQFFLPNTNPFEPKGYWITLIVHTYSFVYGAMGVYVGDLLFIFFSYHIYVLSQILKYKTEELNDSLEMPRNETKIALMVLDIASFHQDFCTYSKTIEKMYFWNAFFLVSMTSFSICLTLFIIIAGEWPGAPVFLIYLFVSMYLYCGMGTLVEYSCDEVTNYICNINWYELSQSQKKTYQIILMRSQTPTLITVGGVLPLSVSTGLQVTKTIYSYFMMLLQFLE